MNLNILGRVCRAAAIGAILFGSVSCIDVNDSFGENFIPTDQLWDVFPCEAEVLENIELLPADKLSGYSTARLVFGSISDGEFSSTNSTSFTLVPFADSLDFGKQEDGYPEIIQFHFSAARDTTSVLHDDQEKILQNVNVYSLSKPLDATAMYTGSDLNNFVDFSKRITNGIPVYSGGDSLSFDFSKEFARQLMDGVLRFQSLRGPERDSIKYYIDEVPGIYISSDAQPGKGGRINMFGVKLDVESQYLMGNFAELKIRGKYDYSDEPVDTAFIFYYGPSKFIADGDNSYPPQYALNTSVTSGTESLLQTWENNKENLFVEGGSGLKPVVKAREIKRVVEEIISEQNIDPKEAVINKATIILPYEVTDYELLDKYPHVLSPTVRLYDKDNDSYTYAGLTDASVATENQGDINRSLSMYSPDLSFHVQEILKLKDDATFEDYDVWFLIMHEEIIATTSSGNNYNNLLYNNYYNMMYDPYGYGYGYGGYGGYGYNNYYNYYMMMQLANAANSSTTTYSSSIELDRDRFYNAKLSGPAASGAKPSIKITFSAPKSAKR